MFYVYGTDGRHYAGTLEAVLGDRKVEAIQRIGLSGRGGYRNRQPRQEGAPEQENPASSLESEAVAAYRKTAQLERQIGPILHARQIMTYPVLSAFSTDSVQSAWNILETKGIRHLPILSKSADARIFIAGIISEKDFYRDTAIPANPGEREKLPIGAVMRTPVLIADPLTDIRRIARLMFERHIGCVPVAGEDGSLQGMVTRSDILRALINHPSFSIWG